MTWPTPPVARRLGRGLLTALVCAVSFELATRIDDWARFGTPLWSPVAVEEDLLIRDAVGEHGKPHAQFQKWTLNNVGMRGPDVTVAKVPGVVRVVTAGASETFGLYESPGREFPRQLEDSLATTLTVNGCSGLRAEVLNAAIFGMSLPSVDQDLALRVAPLHPDVVVLYPTPVQYLADGVPQPAAPDSATARASSPISTVLRSRASSELRNQLKQVVPLWAQTWLRRRDIEGATAGRPSDWRFTSVPPDRIERYDRDLRHAIGTIHAIGAAAVIMTHANLFMPGGPGDSAQLAAQLTAWERFYPRATARTITAFDSVAAGVTLRAAADSGDVAVDLAQTIRRTPARAAAPLFGDYAHFSDLGAAQVASVLRPAVLEAARLGARCPRGAPVVTAVRRLSGRR
jgi:hypothetical protein